MSQGTPAHGFPHQLLSIGDVNQSQLEELLERAALHEKLGEDYSNRVYGAEHKELVSLFAEPSTRTEISFALAARRIGLCMVQHDAAHSSMAKGENLVNTLVSLDAMGIDGLIVRHSGADELEEATQRVRARIISAGSGVTHHPSQALLDFGVMRKKFGRDMRGLPVAIMGDIAHSRVAGSLIPLLRAADARITLIAPDTHNDDDYGDLNHTTSAEQGIEDKALVIVLRPQWERHDTDATETRHDADDLVVFRLDHQLLSLAQSDVKIMHPGPVTAAEISPELAADERYSLVNEQIRYGVFMRMAILSMMFTET